MKDWRLWAFLIGIYLVVKMCGGCNSCTSDSSNSQSEESSDNKPTQTCRACGKKTTSWKFLGSDLYCLSCYNERKGMYEELYGKPPVKVRPVY